MRDLHINLRFWVCAATEVNDVMAYAHVLNRHRIILLAHRTLEPLHEEAWRTTFQRERDEETYFKSSVSHAIAFEDWGKLNADFGFDEYKKSGNKLELGGLLDFQFQNQCPLVEPFAQRLLAVAHELYPLARPLYGEIDGGWGEWESKDILKLRLKHISWVNFFGPAYVEKYGRDFFLNLPGYKTQLLPDGGVFHQLSPTFVAPDRKQAKVLRQEVIAYCAEHGLKVTCRAPHSLPEVSTMTEATSREPADTADLHSYLDQILATTLALDDGTRVKPIYIPWEELSAAEEVVAVRRIQEAVLEEVRGRKGDRLRLEFNQIPEALEQALVELFGRDNPDVEWVEVE